MRTRSVNLTDRPCATDGRSRTSRGSSSSSRGATSFNSNTVSILLVWWRNRCRPYCGRPVARAGPSGQGRRRPSAPRRSSWDPRGPHSVPSFPFLLGSVSEGFLSPFSFTISVTSRSMPFDSSCTRRTNFDFSHERCPTSPLTFDLPSSPRHPQKKQRKSSPSDWSFSSLEQREASMELQRSSGDVACGRVGRQAMQDATSGGRGLGEWVSSWQGCSLMPGCVGGSVPLVVRRGRTSTDSFLNSLQDSVAAQTLLAPLLSCSSSPSSSALDAVTLATAHRLALATGDLALAQSLLSRLSASVDNSSQPQRELVHGERNLFRFAVGEVVAPSPVQLTSEGGGDQAAVTVAEDTSKIGGEEEEGRKIVRANAKAVALVYGGGGRDGKLEEVSLRERDVRVSQPFILIMRCEQQAIKTLEELLPPIPSSSSSNAGVPPSAASAAAAALSEPILFNLVRPSAPRLAFFHAPTTDHQHSPSGHAIRTSPWPRRGARSQNRTSAPDHRLGRRRGFEGACMVNISLPLM